MGIWLQIRRQVINEMRAIIHPTIAALGVSLSLALFNQNHQPIAYFAHIPFWIGCLRPLGIYWNQSFLKEINKGVFPAEMKVYREMYTVSNKAIFYDVILNHTLYHSGILLLLVGFSYGARTLYDRVAQSPNSQPNKRRKIWTILGENLGVLAMARVTLSTFSITSELILSKLLKKNDGNRSYFTEEGKKLLLTKEFVLQVLWYAYVLHRFNVSYETAE